MADPKQPNKTDPRPPPDPGIRNDTNTPLPKPDPAYQSTITKSDNTPKERPDPLRK